MNKNKTNVCIIKYKKLKDIVKIVVGGDKPIVFSEVKRKKYIYPIIGNGTNDKSILGYTDKYKINNDCISISSRGTIGYPVLRRGPIYPVVRLICLIPNEEVCVIKFLKYFLDTYNFKVNQTGIKQLVQKNVENIEIPIISIEEQNKIVEILDKFTNYKAELTAELTFREEQYKYYRDKLFSKHCSDLDYKPFLKEVTILNKFKQPQANELEKMIDMNGNIPLLPSSRNYNWFTTLDKAKKWLSNGNIITLGRARNPNIKKCGGYFVSSNNIIIQSFDEKILSYKYLYYFLDNIKESFYVESASYPKFDRDIFDQTKIPIPPIEIQDRIVEILDKFSSLINEISDGLPKEIELRNKQYEYYRNLLLDFSQQKE